VGAEFIKANLFKIMINKSVYPFAHTYFTILMTPPWH